MGLKKISICFIIVVRNIQKGVPFMNNRLKIVRKAQGQTQRDISSMLGIAQSTYSYWEKGTVSIDHKAMLDLARHFQVSVEFLGGEEYTLRHPVSEWSEKLRNEYESAKPYMRTYMEYIHGRPLFYEKPSAADGAAAAIEAIGENTVVYCRNGQNVRYSFTKEQMDVIIAVFNSLSDKDGEK